MHVLQPVRYLPISPLYLTYIPPISPLDARAPAGAPPGFEPYPVSPLSPLYLPDTSLISPRYLRCISPNQVLRLDEADARSTDATRGGDAEQYYLEQLMKHQAP